MKKKTLQKTIALILAGLMAGSVMVTAAMSVNAAGSSLDLKNESVGIVGSFNNWGDDSADIPMSDEDNDGVWEGIIDIPEVTEEMVQQAVTADEIGDLISRGFSGILFKVRLNGKWENNWADYEPLYNRTWNSQTYCAVEASAGQSLKIKVKLDTTTIADQSDIDPSERYEPGDGDEWIVWPVSYEILEQTDPLTNTSSMAYTKPFMYGKSITVIPRAKGGAGGYSFAVYYKKAGTVAWTCAKTYESGAGNVSVTPGSVGEYIIRVKAKDAAGKVVNKDVRVTVESSLKNKSTLMYETPGNGTDAAVFGTKVTVNCAAADAAGTVKYEVYYKQTKKTNWTRAQKYSTNSVVSFTPKAATDYQVCVRAKDESGKVVKQNMTFTVTNQELPDLINRTGISYPTPLTPGSQVTLNCASENAVGEVQYAVYYKPVSSTNWTTAQKYSTNTVVHFAPKKATDYNVSVKAKDGRGQVKKLTYSLTVTKLPLTNTSYAPSYSLVNKPLVIHPDAEGGKEGYQYAVYYKRASKTSYTTLKKYSTDPAAAFTPKYKTTYDIKVKVKDAGGTVVTKYMKVKVVGSKSQIPALSGSYRTVFSQEVEDYISTLPEAVQQSFNILKNSSTKLIESGLTETSVPNNDGTYETGYGTWHDNYDGTLTVSQLSGDTVFSYTVSDDGSVTLYDPEQPTVTLQKTAD